MQHSVMNNGYIALGLYRIFYSGRILGRIVYSYSAE